MKRVDFIILGVQKCGTTTLAHWVSQHPQVLFCNQKEPDFFSRNANWQDNLEEYHRLYEACEGASSKEKFWMEASTSYSWYLEYPDVAERLYHYNPDLKLIYIVREPISRIKSHYRHNFLKGYTRKSFSKAVIEEPEYLAHSSYEVQIRPFTNYFKRDNILFLKFEDLISKEEGVLRDVYSFLGLSAKGVENKLDLSPRNVSRSLKKVSRLKKYVAPLFRFLPEGLRRKYRQVLYRDHEVFIDSNPKLEDQLFQLLYNDIRAFKDLSGIDYLKDEIAYQ